MIYYTDEMYFAVSDSLVIAESYDLNEIVNDCKGYKIVEIKNLTNE